MVARIDRLLSVALLALWLLPGAAASHPIYVSLPKETVTDNLSKSPVVVLARLAPDNAFRFNPDVWLKGDSGADLPAIPNLVDSATRRQLLANDDEGVYFVHGPDDQGWRRVAYGDAEVREMVDTILNAAPQWELGRDDPARFAFFAERHDHPNATIRTFSLVEITQARYGLIRTLTPALNRSQIQKSLRDPMQAPLAPLYIVMLGLIDDAEAAAIIRKTVAQALDLDFGGSLTAWATALIEIDGSDAVEMLAETVLPPGRVARATAEAVLTALALHGTEGHVALRDRIAEILSKSAEIDAAYAASAVLTLVQWQDWRAIPTIRSHLSGSAPIDLRDRLVLASYLTSAQQAGVKLEDSE